MDKVSANRRVFTGRRVHTYRSSRLQNLKRPLIIYACLLILLLTQVESFQDLLGVEYILFFTLFAYLIFKFVKTKKMQVRVFEDHLQIAESKKKYKINYADITKIEYKINVTLHYGKNQQFSFDHYLERADYIIDAIIQYNPDLITKEMYQKIIRELVSVDHFEQRLVTNSNRGFTVFSKSLLGLMMVYVVMVYYKQTQQYDLSIDLDYWSGLVFTSFLLLFLNMVPVQVLVNGYKVRRSQENLKNNQRMRDSTYDDLWDRRGKIIVFSLQALYLSLAYVANLNLFTFAFSHEGLQTLGYKKDDIFIIHKAYRCLNCRKALQVNDRILFESDSETIASIVALPGGFTPQPDLSKQTVGVNQLGVLVVDAKGEKGFKIIPLDSVIGKVVGVK
jgi:hypothetical protein